MAEQSLAEGGWKSDGSVPGSPRWAKLVNASGNAFQRETRK